MRLLASLPMLTALLLVNQSLLAWVQASLKAGNSGRTELKSAETSVIGALAGAVTGFATTPLDVIKTRLMTQGERGQYKGIVDCALVKSTERRATSAFLRVGRHSTKLSSRPIQPAERRESHCCQPSHISDGYSGWASCT